MIWQSGRSDAIRGDTVPSPGYAAKSSIPAKAAGTDPCAQEIGAMHAYL